MAACLSPEGFLLQLLQLCLQLEVSAPRRAVDVLYGVRLVKSLHQDLVFCQQTALLLLQGCHLWKGTAERMEQQKNRKKEQEEKVEW